MKLTKKLQAEVLKFYKAYWDAYLDGDMKTFASMLDDEITVFGTAVSEVFNSKKEAVKFYNATADQLVGKAQFRNSKFKLQIVDDAVLINQQCDFYILLEKKWTFYGHARVTAILKQTKAGWKLVHQHASFPDVRAEEGEQVAAEKIKQENLQLRDAVKRRTIELEEKNRELEIETALEKVRAVAMSMKEPADMLKICKIISGQLQKLGVKEIRNVQTAIINEEKGTYLNYEYFTQYKRTDILEIEIELHPAVKEFSKQILKSKDGMFIKSFKGKALTDWRNYRKKTGQNPDPILDKAKSLHYYFYSIGPGALGISIYSPLKDEEIELFKRFRNVFALAYKRFTDIEKANAQAREAQIEVAVERVRAKALAMHRSEEISDVANVLRKELSGLNIPGVAAATITLQQDNGKIRLWDITSVVELEDGFHFAMDFLFDLKGTKPDDWIRRIWDSREKYFVYKQDRKKFKRTLEWTAKYDPRFVENARVFLETNNIKNTWHPVVPLSHGKLSLDLFQEPVAEVESILAKMAAAFDLAYKRFLDLKKAEAQTREAQIEAALERVRSRTMGMHKTDELLDAAELVSKELSDLGVISMNVSYAFVDEQKKTGSYYSLNPVDRKIVPIAFVFPHTETEVMRSILKSWKKQEPFNVIELNELATLKHQTYIGGHIQKQLAINGIPFSIKSFLKVSPKKAVLSTFNFKNGYLFNIGGIRLTQQQEELLLRFTKVFEQTYIRFLDLQKAEAQARESQIQLALERVRARTMAMHHSDELSDVVKLLYQEFDKLKISNESTDIEIGLINEETGFASVWAHLYLSDGTISTFDFPIGHFEGTIHEFKKWKATPVEKRNALFFTSEFKGKFWEKFKKWIKKFPELAEAFQPMIEANITQWITHNAYFSHGIITLQGTELYSPETQEIQKRFTKVFEQTYTRFLDLQKAEAQAREAQIEAALERVRARSMGMQKSDELAEVVAVLYKQFEELDFGLYQVLVSIYDKKNNVIEWWSKGFGDLEVPQRNIIPIIDHPFNNDLFEKWENGVEYYPHVLEGELKESWDEYLFTKTDLKNFPQEVKDIMRGVDKVYLSDVFMKYGSLQAAGPAPLPDDKAAILKRFVKVLDLAYTRMKDLQTAELQTREAQIELGLERVRSRAMAMQTSEELNELIGTVFTELTKLDLVLTRCVIWVFDQATNEPRWWMANSEEPSNPMNFLINYHEHPAYLTFLQAWKKQNVKFVYDLKGEDKVSWDDILFNETELKNLPDVVKNGMRAPERVLLSASFNNFGGINVASLEHLSEEHFDILLRFAKVFDLTYTRFNDLKQAEAQARESQIQLALERVRARTMAMQRSDELLGVVSTLYEQLNNLQFDSNACNIIIIDKETNNQRYWVSGFTQKLYPESYNVPYFQHPYIDDQLQAWKEGRNYIVIEYSGKMKQEFDKQFFSQTDFKNIPVEVQKVISALPSAKLSTAFFTYGALQMIGPKPLNKENAAILQRFAKVFDQTYTRFLDLQKAEAQAREAQIELGLERVRARAMAMQRSDELKELIATLSAELGKLDIILDRSFIIIYDTQTMGSTWWMANPETPSVPIGLFVKYHEHPSYLAHIEAWKNRKIRWEYILEADTKKTWDQFLFVETELSRLPDFVIDNMRSKEKVYLSSSFNNFGYLTLATLEPLTNEQFDIMLRFAKVFDLTYTRFNDLKQAEAQAREAQIQLALERVRARTMAMQKSDELSETAAVLFKQFQDLGEDLMQMTIGVINEEERVFDFNVTDWGGGGSQVDRSFKLSIDEPSLISKFYKAWKEQTLSIVVDLTGIELEDWIRYRNETSGITVSSLDTLGRRVITAAAFSRGVIAYSSPIPRPEESRRLLERFAGVFDLTYTRFLDLQKAEAQSRESQIQLALERVRARTMAMQKSNELMETAVVLFNQLSQLGENIERTIIGVINEEERAFDVWATRPDGSQMVKMQKFTIDEPIVMKKIYVAWQQQKKSIIIDLQGEELESYFQFLKAKGSQLKRESFGERRIENFAFFSKGILGVINADPKVPANVELYERFAAVFDQTYTRFLDLQKSEAQAREAQIQLALERVRARTMAMQKSDELSDTAYLLFQQFKELGAQANQFSIGIINEEEEVGEMYATIEGDKLLQKRRISIHEPIAFGKVYAAWKANKKSIILEISGKELETYNIYRNKIIGQKIFPEEIKAGDRWIIQCFFFSSGVLSFASSEPASQEILPLLERFTNVFEGTYTRFLDLKQAEAQAREAKIEAALEKVRARTMGMQRSDELPQAANLLFQQIQSLGMPAFAAGYCIWDDDKQAITLWMSSEGVLQPPFKAPTTEDELFIQMRKGYEEGKSLHVVEMGGEELVAHYKYMHTLPVFGEIVDSILKAGHSLPVFQVMHQAYFSKGFLLFITYEPVPEAHDIFKRFATVFDQTYTRFLDLQKAEAQAHEARVEISLERIRARALAMHKSDELKEVAKVLWEQMALLGQAELEASVVHLYEEDPDNIHSWRAVSIGTDSSTNLTFGHMVIPKNSCEFVQEWLAKFYSDQQEYTLELSGVKQKEWYGIMAQLAPEVFNSMRWKQSIEEKRYYRFSKFSGGALLMVSKQEPSAEVGYLQKRAAVVFDLAYRRFLDLQKAEAQAREAQIELSLERVRAKTMAMHQSEELVDTSVILFQELKSLGLNAIRTGVAIINDTNETMELWSSQLIEQKQNKVLGVVPMDAHPFFTNLLHAWRKKDQGFSFEMTGDEVKKYYESISPFLSYPPQNTYNQREIFNPFFFPEGSLTVVSHQPLSIEERSIMQRFARVFGLLYRRFLDLQRAEAQTREAQIEAALEKVRSRSLAMHKSDELQEVVNTVFEKLTDLEIKMDSCNIAIFKEGTKDFEYWISSPFQKRAAVFKLPYTTLSLTRDIIAARESGVDFSSKSYSFEEKNEWFEYAFKETDFKFLTEERKRFILDTPGITVSIAFSKYTGVQINQYATRVIPDAEKDILKRFSKVFEQAYIRFLDLEKAEAQAREAQIEASLERVRSKTMAMHNSNDVGETVAAMFAEFVNLGIHTNRCGILIFNNETSAEVWTARSNPEGKANLIIGKLNLEVHNLLISVYKAWRSQNVFYQYDLMGEDMLNYYEAINNSKFYPTQFDISKLPQKEIHSDFFFPEGAVFAFTKEPIPEEHSKIFKRFAGVFGQTYRRYLDLQKAEAQAREAQIEASLERVRAKAMAMHRSDDLNAAVAIVFEELDRLKLGLIRCGIAILDKERPRGDIWITIKSEQGSTVQVSGDEALDIHPLLQGAYNGWLRNEDFSYVLENEDLVSYYTAITKTNFQQPIFSDFHSGDKEHPQYYFNAVFQNGSLFAFLDTIFTDEAKSVMKRFANVFNLTYKRFLDLQKAEANAREAQIEAGLERVRARTMGMHSSDDVSAATATMFIELEKLGIENYRGGITNIHPNRTQEVWSVNNLAEGKVLKAVGAFNIDAHPFWKLMYSEWQSKKDFTHYFLWGQDKEEYIKILNTTQGYLSQTLQQFPDVHFQVYYFNEGAVWTNSLQPHSEEEKQIMKRFTSVFSLTFRRYQDLKKAEAQAREATIEAALEKVRGKAMAMHNSNDLAATTSLIIGELRKLGITPIRCGVGIINKETHKAQLYTARTSAEGDSLSVVGWVMLKGHPVLENIYETFVKGQDYFPELIGDSLRSYYEQLLAGLSVPLPDFKDGQKHYGHFFAVSVGCLYAWADVRYNDDQIKILRRFAAIIDLTFRRYIELQKSEANAREAVKQAALDRVRADIASMRTIEDLDRITPLIWNELTTLNIPFIRCGVFIMDDSQQFIHTFLSTPDGKAIAAFHLPYDTPGNIGLVISNWRNKRQYVDHWDEEEFIQFADILMKEGALTSREQYLKTIPKGGFYLHFLPFLQGMLYVGNTEKLNEEQIELIQHVADAFSTAYARYEDFNRLEAAKKQVENTLTDLKQAQTQLVQSEKMASLGELTAGIAHEIQNPLNFVNNFSDVSNELLEEMKNELEKGNKEDAIAIVEDVKQNLEKILHHGKRADAIVKGMLQHSRTSSGQKEMTDINILADEYLRLAYHGLRAKDKSFNAKFETHFDNNIGKVNVIPQDIGRVILNLINNAFYTVTEKKKGNQNGYEPTVTITTQLDNGKIEIKVRDNGNGIPQKNIDKIFQPFFTTKPTGQGTGLGLSLAYDIVTKGHSGELKVETKEGEGSEFIIQLPLKENS